LSPGAGPQGLGHGLQAGFGGQHTGLQQGLGGGQQGLGHGLQQSRSQQQQPTSTNAVAASAIIDPKNPAFFI